MDIMNRIPSTAELAEMDTWMVEDMAFATEGKPAYTAYETELNRRANISDGLDN
jgi:hypothetical protein